MSFKLKVQRTIHAPIEKVWEGLTQPEWVKQYFFGTQLVTTWQPQTPIYFKGEWEGVAYEDKGTVLRYEPYKVLIYNYHSSMSDLADLPENYQIISYRVKTRDNATVVTVEQSNISAFEKKEDSAKGWAGMMLELKKLMEHAHN
jgi:uncharacterized protein YndB with AHSA1/START domain